MRITGDIPMLRDILSGAMLDLIGRICMVIVVLGILIYHDPLLAIVSGAVLLTVTVLSAFFTKRIAKVAKKQREREGLPGPGA